VLIISLLGQTVGLVWLLGWRAAGASRKTRLAIVAVGLLSLVSAVFAFLLRFDRVARHFPLWWPSWGRAIAITWALLSLCWLVGYPALWIWSRMQRVHSPARRLFFKTAYTAVLAAAIVVGYGVFHQTSSTFLREQKLEFPDLPPDLDGLRLSRLSISSQPVSKPRRAAPSRQPMKPARTSRWLLGI
jgi:hypothetical protein